ncbi:hypothetical protein HM131_01930 [Halobacillus mangrovi]|uniref:Uncharacterized protein n=1 Tax=Halobacillus mangrovi TaxID=402384 RepID=A0A1W5ZQU8_9BACI|nr:hypothetical protein HM131_01930 [Halobacillus mangrovi]
MFNSDIFDKNILKKAISKGWWAIQDPLKRAKYLLFHLTEHPPSTTDQKGYEKLIKNGPAYPCYFKTK